MFLFDFECRIDLSTFCRSFASASTGRSFGPTLPTAILFPVTDISIQETVVPSGKTNIWSEEPGKGISFLQYSFWYLVSSGSAEF